MYQQQNTNTEYMQNNKNINANHQKLNQVDDKPIINLPDILRENLDIIVVGITPSGMLGVSNHHFSGPGNHFWRCIAEVGLVSHPVTCEDDTKMLDYGIGFISFCTRPNKGTTELSRKEMKAGAALMVEKIKTFKPKIVVFNGIGIYEAFIGNKNFSMGLQPNKMEGTNSVIFVMPSSSARCAQLPRAEDKIPFFVSLKKLRDHMRGELPQLEEKEVVFENYTEFRVTQPDPRSLLKAERRRKRKAELSAESALHETVFVDNSNANFAGHEDNKPKTTPEIETTKDERSYENSQNPFPSSIQNQSTIVTPPLLSWPQSGGLTIIHTGQPIIMPSTGSQAASSNTLLLLDPGSLSFSSIPVPMSQAHLQVRPMLLPSDNESRVPATIVSSSSPATGPPAKLHTEINSSPHFTNAPQHIKARPVNDIIKSAPPIKNPPTRANSTNAKATSATTPNSVVKTNYIDQTKTIVEQTSKPILSTMTITTNVTTTTTSTDNDINIPTTSTAPSGNEKDRSTDEAAVQQSKSKPARPTNDPIDQWDLFMNGIHTGEFTYPAPPRTTLVSAAEAIAEYDQLSQSSVSRILTVLL